MLVGYARVSTQDQTLDLQKDALEKAGCSKLFTDTASGAKKPFEKGALAGGAAPEWSVSAFRRAAAPPGGTPCGPWRAEPWSATSAPAKP
jgi:hypothetical protein